MMVLGFAGLGFRHWRRKRCDRRGQSEAFGLRVQSSRLCLGERETTNLQPVEAKLGQGPAKAMAKGKAVRRMGVVRTAKIV
jgi:hypothetical protein